MALLVRVILRIPSELPASDLPTHPLTASHELNGHNVRTLTELPSYILAGLRIASLCRSLGMQVLIAARKPYDYLPHEVPVGRTPSHTVIRRATVLFVVVPLNPETRHIIGAPELDAARPDCIVVNVGRGGTVDERALLAAVRERRIYGAATDVFETEPAGSDADSVLLSREVRKEGLNLVLTPHLAWCADTTRMNIRRVVGENIRTFVNGGSTNVVLDAR